MYHEVLRLADAVWECVSTSTGSWSWLIERTSPAANLFHSTFTSLKQEKLKDQKGFCESLLWIVGLTSCLNFHISVDLCLN